MDDEILRLMSERIAQNYRPRTNNNNNQRNNNQRRKILSKEIIIINH